MKKFSLQDWGEEQLQQTEENYHPMASIEAYRDGLTPEQRRRMTEDEIIAHYADLGFKHGLRQFGWGLVNTFPKYVLGLSTIFKPELSLTQRASWMIKQCNDCIRACGSKQNVQQLFKGMRDDPVNGKIWEQWLTVESGEIKPKTSDKLQGVKNPNNSELFDSQMQMNELLDEDFNK